MGDIQLPFGRHHIHCYLFASCRHKLDGYWHGFFVLLVLYAAPRTSTFKIVIFRVFGAEHIDNNNKQCNLRQDMRENDLALAYNIRTLGSVLQENIQGKSTEL